MTAGPEARGPVVTPPGMLALVCLALPVYFIALGANSIWEANEAFYVDTPRHMVETGDYVTPIWNGEPRVNKPVLSYWLVAGLYQLFGVSVAVERFGIAIGAMGIVLAAFAIGRAWRSTVVGVVAALIVASAPRVVMFSRRIFIDVWVTCFMALALACFVLAERRPAHRRRYLLLMYLCLGLGVLTKGPVAVVLPAAAFLAWIAIERRWRDLAGMMLLPGAFIILAIVAPWYVALYLEHGWGPVVGFFVGENLERFATSMVPGDRNLFFYVPVLFGDLFPWAPLLILPIALAWKPAAVGESAGEAGVRRLLWLWVVVTVGGFSLSQTKQDLYIFPVVPAVAALVADLLVGSAFGQHRVAVRRLLAAVAVLTIAGGAAAIWLFRSGYYALVSVTPAAAVLMCGAAVALLAVWMGRMRPAVMCLAAAFVAFNYLFVWRVLPEMERLKPAVALASVINARVSPTNELGEYGGALPPSLVFYVKRPIQRMGDLDHVASFFASDRGSWMLVEEPNYAAVAARVSGLCEVARRPVFEAKARDLLEGRPPHDILLVTNQCAISR